MTRFKTNKAYITFTFLVAIFVLLVLAFYSFQLFNRQKNETNLVTHTFRVKLKIEEVLSLLKDAETFQRGYLLTNDSSFLKSFEKTLPVIDSSITGLHRFIADNKKQQQDLQEITTMVRYRISILQKVVSFYGTVVTAERAKTLLEGKRIMEMIRNRITLFEQYEDKLLLERMNKKAETDKQTLTTISFFALVSLTILIVYFLRLRRENKKRLRAEFTSEQLEAKVKERTQEIENMNRQLQSQNALLERQNEELNSITFVASHDLKEPLRKIEMFTARISREEAAGFSIKSQGYFNSLIKATSRMQKLIDDVLSYAQTNVPQLWEQTNLNDILQQARDTLHESILEKNAVIHVSKLPTLYAIPQQLEQLFTNLLSNSLKYAKAGTPAVISISATRKVHMAADNTIAESYWEIDFADNGIGFDPVHSDKIFQIFQRLHSQSEYSGTGIGLAICKKIAENHYGSIRASSTPGTGAVFTVLLQIIKT
jgi:signal transduction histidine kinase